LLTHYKDWFSLSSKATQDGDLILLQANQAGERPLENVFLWNMPKDMSGLKLPVMIEILSSEQRNDGSVEIHIRSDNLAVFVVLTTLAQGRFIENCFSLRPNSVKVRGTFIDNTSRMQQFDKLTVFT